MPTTSKLTPGAIRAGQKIAAHFRRHLQFLSQDTDHVLAAIIDAETGAQEMLETLKAVADVLPVAARLHPDDLFRLQTRIVDAIAKGER